MKKKIIISVLIVAAAAVTLYFTVLRTGDAAEIGYNKEALKTGSIEALVDTTGTLNAVTMVDVGAQVSGKIINIYVDFNSEVQAGQVIARIDPEQFQTRIKQSEANYRSAKSRRDNSKINLENSKKKYERAKNLFEKDLISIEEMDTSETNYYGAVSDLQTAEATLEQQQSALDSSKVDLSYTVIKSPIDGVVINRNINEGQTVASSLQAPVLFQIAKDLTEMQVECVVDEADIGRVAEGQSVRFTVDAYPNENFRGTVKQVRYAPEVVSNVVTYTTIVEVSNAEMKLRPGMTATVAIVVGEARNKLLVPNTAMRFTPDLSQEEMRALFQEMRGGEQGGQTDQKARPEGQQAGERQRPQGQMGMPGGMSGRAGGGMHGSQDMGRVWYEDENGKLRMLSFKLGVTDNVYTEVVSGDITEGLEVIIGQTQSGSSSNRGNDAMRMMRFMR
ncbi:MAG: efflux RND transporter periplasmic adaptor subunit [Candidatus Aminicenantaceae bacterium]